MAEATAIVKQTGDKTRGSLRQGKETHVRSYRVKLLAGGGTYAALHATGIPIEGAGYAEGSPLIATAIDCNPVPNSAQHFDVTVEYTTPDAATAAAIAARAVDPVERPPEISFGANESTEPYFMDRSATPKPTVNSAGEPFEQFLQREGGHRVITYARNEASFDPDAADALSNTTNSAAVTIDGKEYAADTLKLGWVTAQKATETWKNDGVDTVATFYKVSYPIKRKLAGWHDKPLDMGYQFVFTHTPPVILNPILNAVGTPITKPWPLDGNGNAQTNATDAPAELDFLPYTSADWTDLHLEWTGGAFPPESPPEP